MIFEITYNELQVPLAMIKELLTDKEYKGDVKLVTFEANKDNVSLYFNDERLGIRFKYVFHEAEMELPGTATCSFASFYELVKVFKKSEEMILIERDGLSLRVDDGQYPEELLILKGDADLHPYPTGEHATPLFSMESKVLAEAIGLASTILKKTDIPPENIDTQAVYLSTEADAVSFTSFSLHNFHRSKRPAVIDGSERVIQLTKPVASAINKIIESGKKHFSEWRVADFKGGDYTEIGISLQSGDGQADFHFRLEPVQVEASIQTMFGAIESGFLEAVKKVEIEKALGIENIGKVKTDDNLVVENGEFRLSPSGYPAQLIRKLWEKGAWKEEGTLFYVDSGSSSMPVMCLYESANGVEKITGLSYRNNQSA